MRYLTIALLLFFLMPAAAARQGIGISPGCIGADPQGKCIFLNVMLNQSLEYEYHVYNFDDAERTFKVSAEGSLSKHITIEPEEFTLQKHSGRDCSSSPGCQVVIVKINQSTAEPGSYTTEISAATSALSGGMIALNQIVKAKLLLNISEPPKPSIIEKITKRFSSSTESEVTNKTEKEAEETAKSNGWLGPAAIALLLLIFFAAKRFRKPEKGKKTKKEKKTKKIKQKNEE